VRGVNFGEYALFPREKLTMTVMAKGGEQIYAIIGSNISSLFSNIRETKTISIGKIKALE